MSNSQSWVPVPPKSHFSLANIPFGIISTKSDPTHRPAVAIGDHALDLRAFAKAGGFHALPSVQERIAVFSSPTLNDFAALGRPVHRDVRSYLQSVLSDNTPYAGLLKDNAALRRTALVPLAEARNHLPLAVGDYTDFYAGKNHAYNLGVLFRGPDNALQPNYVHLPVAYHGRASSVVVSGTPIRRPWGQILRDPGAQGPKVPVLAPCERLDIELEMGAFLCRGNALGEPVPVDDAEEHIFGYVLLNDWSARDIQAWEYVPLGPFTAKNLGTSISPWVVLADALEASKTAGIENTTELLPYLRESRKNNLLGVQLEVDIITASGNKTTISRTNSSNLLWSWPQMIAHHTISGCNLRPGDLLGSGTISGTEPGTEGSILEQTRGGKQTMKLSGGEERKFLQDGDTMVIRGWSGEEGALVGFGEVSGTIEAALKLF
ncbi:Fumarylacetoacetase [Colletotrichum tanaceti]|uniref:Fumarylacetoacetase n=1 Tax=Colletotrichum tanaceti TaxID=1306861 RepID=A0A4U6XC43_9PEZI|nr:Fumarylacetoacetase [Colletotrichum tanaceti]